VWGTRIPPYPRPREGLALTQGNGETRFPHSPTRGRVWEGAAPYERKKSITELRSSSLGINSMKVIRCQGKITACTPAAR